jgi:hypothetical protein
MNFLESKTEMEFGVQDDFRGQPYSRKGRKQDWAEGEVKLHCRLTKETPDRFVLLPSQCQTYRPPLSITGCRPPQKRHDLGLSCSAANTDLEKLTTKAVHLHVHRHRHFALQRILSVSIYFSMCLWSANILPSQVMNHLTVFLKMEIQSYALSYSLNIIFW